MLIVTVSLHFATFQLDGSFGCFEGIFLGTKRLEKVMLKLVFSPKYGLDTIVVFIKPILVLCIVGSTIFEAAVYKEP